LRGKNKSLLEDIIILFIVGVLVFFAYNYFFPSSEETVEETTEIIQPNNNSSITENKSENTPIEVEKKEEIVLPKAEERALEEKVIENRIIAENKIEEKIPEPVKKEEIVLPKIEEKVVEKPITNSLAENKIVPVVPLEKKVEQKEIEKPIFLDQSTKELEEKAKIEAFYKTIREQIFSNIGKNIDSSLVKQGEFINIRLTILKDGRYEQLTFIEGNKDYLELIRPSLSQVFPVVIDDSLKANFPRYFRIKVEF
jgi:hypothetical protein